MISFVGESFSKKIFVCCVVGFLIRSHGKLDIRCCTMFGLTQLHQQCDEESTSSSSSRRRHDYDLLGEEVGLDCLACILGIGKKRILRCQKGHVDMRYGEQALRLNPKATSVDRFLLDLYGSVAETLPTQIPCSKIAPLSC